MSGSPTTPLNSRGRPNVTVLEEFSSIADSEPPAGQPVSVRCGPSSDPDESLAEELARFAPNDALALADLAARLREIKRHAEESSSIDLEAVWAEVELQLGPDAQDADGSPENGEGM